MATKSSDEKSLREKFSSLEAELKDKKTSSLLWLKDTEVELNMAIKQRIENEKMLMGICKFFIQLSATGMFAALGLQDKLPGKNKLTIVSIIVLLVAIISLVSLIYKQSKSNRLTNELLYNRTQFKTDLYE